MASAPHPLGPWTDHGPCCTGPGAETSFHSQPTAVIPLGGDRFLYVGDRWSPERIGESRTVWIPFIVPADGIPTLRME